MRAGKRGQRLPWKDEKGDRTDVFYIAHCSDKICWRAATQDEVPHAVGGSKAPKFTPEDFLAILMNHFDGLTAMQWNTIAKDDFGVSKRVCERMRDQLKAEGEVYYDYGTRIWQLMSRAGRTKSAG